jgi:hypothetical protein
MLGNKTSTARITAMYNAAATELGEKTVKKFADRATAGTRTEDIFTRLPGRQFYRDPRPDEVGPMRNGSLIMLMATALDADEGVTEAALSKIIADFYADRRKKISDPTKQLHSVLNHLARTRGLGFRRIGNRYWLVQP